MSDTGTQITSTCSIMGDDLPLIVTADLDPRAMTLLDAPRQEHFPPARNHLRAHLTLFHHLPGAELAAVQADLAEVADRDAPPATLDRVLKLGRGVAYAVDSPGLTALRRDLAARWEPWLTPQDRGWGRPHVTVQN